MRYDGQPDDEPSVQALRLGAIARRLAPLLRPHRRRVAWAAGLLAAAVAADLAGPLVLRRLIDRAIPSGATGAIVGGAGVFLALFVVGRAAALVQAVVLARLGLDVVTALKRRTFDHLLHLSMDHFDRNPPGKLMARVESDAERLLAIFSEVGAAVAMTGLVLLGTVAVMFATDARIALLLLGLVAPIAVFNFFYVRYIRDYYGKARAAYARLSAFLSEWVQAVPVIQVFAIEAAARERLAARNQERLGREFGAMVREYPFFGAIQAVEVAMVAAILWFGAGALSIGTLVLFVEYARRLFQPIAHLSEQLNAVQRALASADRILDVLGTPTRTPDRPDALEAAPEGWKELRFEDVSFRYADGGRAALEGVSFTVRRGERVALVGRSGSGKSTIASLLLRYYDPQGGRIALDGLDIRGLKKSAWRRRLGLVLQEIHLFPGTLRENLSVFADGVSEDAMRRALGIVEAQGLLERLPRGLDAELAEGGQNLSMGERQLVSFARAVVRDPDILVLDEATSSVDPATERRLQRSLERLLEGRTAIVIAHRLETVRGADRILVVASGKIVEDGNHEELYARKGGIYRDLCDRELGGGAAAGTMEAAA